MAKQKITVESRLRTENTMLKQQLRAAQAALNAEMTSAHREKDQLRHIIKESANRENTALRDLAEARRQLALCQERARNFHVTSLTLSRLVGEGIAQSEDLRYSPASRADNQKSTR